SVGRNLLAEHGRGRSEVKRGKAEAQGIIDARIVKDRGERVGDFSSSRVVTIVVIVGHGAQEERVVVGCYSGNHDIVASRAPRVVGSGELVGVAAARGNEIDVTIGLAVQGVGRVAADDGVVASITE